MVFSSTLFLFIFLPIVLIGNFLLAKRYRNYFLLLASLLFYAWGEGLLVGLMIVSICINYLAGLLIEFFEKKTIYSQIVLGIAIAANLSFLIYYKYFGFIASNISSVWKFETSNFDHITLPIGISFFTFQGISYLIDCYRKETAVQKNPFNLGLYIALFPQLIAGPIVRYHDIALQINQRSVNLKLFTSGLIRFIRGLAKKIFIANTAGLIADKVFNIPIADLPTSMAWIGIICYSLQIYFDFSGYSDMAIGLGRMLGFKFLENFNYPYISKSIQEFWRRWHISLSTWFRDYLYIPLGGSRGSVSRTYFNLIIVFFITGLWHGSSWNFIFWGLFHGLFLILERAKIININKIPPVLRHSYVLLIVIIGWVFFRAASLTEALAFIKCMFSPSDGLNFSPLLYLTSFNQFILTLGIIYTTPARKYLNMKTFGNLKRTVNLNVKYQYKLILYSILLLATILELVQGSYNPFIYFRF